MGKNDLLILGAIGAFILLNRTKSQVEELGGGGSGPIQVLGSPTESFGKIDDVFVPSPLDTSYVVNAQSVQAVPVKTSLLSDPYNYAEIGSGVYVDKTTGLYKFGAGPFAGFAGITTPLKDTPGQKYGELIPASFEDPLVLQKLASANKGKSKSKSVPKKNNTPPVKVEGIPGVNYTPAVNASKACTYTKLDGTCG
jgi:hypothetical protein